MRRLHLWGALGHEDHRHHRHALCLGRHPGHAIRPPQRPLFRQERSRPRHHRDRPRPRGACLPRLLQPARQRRRRQSHRQGRQTDAGRRGPARSRAPLSASVGAHAHEQSVAAAGRGRRGALGSGRQNRQPAGAPPDGQLSAKRAGLCELGGARLARGLLRGGPVVQGTRLDRLQDPSTDRVADRHPRLRVRAQGGRRRLPPDARFDMVLRLYPGAQGRPGRRATRLLLVRGPARRGRSHQLREATPEALDLLPPSTRPAAIRLTRPGSFSRRPTTCAATWP
jgi:hypothetical protein